MASYVLIAIAQLEQKIASPITNGIKDWLVYFVYQKANYHGYHKERNAKEPHLTHCVSNHAAKDTAKYPTLSNDQDFTRAQAGLYPPGLKKIR